MSDAINLRPYDTADEDAAIDVWLRSWQAAYPELDFTSRLDWWRARWRNELVPKTVIVVAEAEAGLAGFVTIQRDGYLDQLVVAPQAWGSGVAALLMAEAKTIAPRGIDLHVNQDNARALRFYRRQGFAVAGESVNPQSGRPTFLMRWKPE